jgi:hypothetical protein
MASRYAPLCALLTLAACARRDPDDAIPAPETDRVRDAGSVITVARTPAAGCPATTPRAEWGRGTVHGGTVTSAETWTRAASPHRLPNGAHIVAGASVRVDPCAVVLVGTGRDLVVQDDARLVAAGTADAPVLFDSASERPTAGDWIGVEIRERALPTSRFAHTTIAHAGAEPPQRGEPSAALRSWLTSGLDVDHLTVRDATGWGVAVLGESGFSPQSHMLRIAGTVGPGAVFFADAEQVRTLPVGDYARNEHADIFLAARGRVVKTDATWRNPGINCRYRIRRAARILVEGANAPRLVIAPGTTVAFEDDAELDVGWERPGALVADGGDARNRVVFTGDRATVTPATWVGILFGAHADTARSRLRFAVVEGAGAPAAGAFVACPLAVGEPLEPTGMVFLQGIRAGDMITHTEFRAGPARGVAVFSSGDSPLPAEDFAAPTRGNVFAAAGVRRAQTTPPRAGRCAPTP